MKRIKLFSKKAWKIIKDTKKYLQEDEPVVYSASIAFFTIFSLPAILIVVTLLGSAIFAEEEVREEIVGRVENLINPEAANQISSVLENVVELPDGAFWIVIGLLVIVKSATVIFFIMQKALNSVWKVRVKNNVNYLQFLKHRLITLAIVVGLGALLLLSTLLDTLVVLFDDHLDGLFEEYTYPIISLISFVFSFLVVLIFFTSILKILPDARVEWRDAIMGGLLTSLLFIIGRQIINYLLNNVKVIGIYAAAGSLVVVLLWVFYSSIILFLGAELTKAYAYNKGRDIEPSSISKKYKITVETDE